MIDKTPTDSQKKAVGVLFADYRTKSHKTQASVGAACGYTKEAVGTWERGEALPHLKGFLAARRLLDIPLEQLEEALGIEVPADAPGEDIDPKLRDAVQLIVEDLLDASNRGESARGKRSRRDS